MKSQRSLNCPVKGIPGIIARLMWMQGLMSRNSWCRRCLLLRSEGPVKMCLITQTTSSPSPTQRTKSFIAQLSNLTRPTSSMKKRRSQSTQTKKSRLAEAIASSSTQPGSKVWIPQISLAMMALLSVTSSHGLGRRECDHDSSCAVKLLLT